MNRCRIFVVVGAAILSSSVAAEKPAKLGCDVELCLNLVSKYAALEEDALDDDDWDIAEAYSEIADTFAQEACDLDSVEGCGVLGSRLINNRFGKRDNVRALKLLGASCLGDFHRACSLLGKLHYEGNSDTTGVRQNYTLALKYYTMACDGSVASSCYWLGRMYEEGTGVKKDAARASQLFAKAKKLDPRLY